MSLPWWLAVPIAVIAWAVAALVAIFVVEHAIWHFRYRGKQ
jgi:hypothetical protein